MRPKNSRITIIRGDYTLQTFSIGGNVEDAPYDLTPFDSIALTVKTNIGLFTVQTVDNDTDNDLENGIVAFRLLSSLTQNMPAGRWPFDIQLEFGSERLTPVQGTAIVLEDINKE